MQSRFASMIVFAGALVLSSGCASQRSTLDQMIAKVQVCRKDPTCRLPARSARVDLPAGLLDHYHLNDTYIKWGTLRCKQFEDSGTSPGGKYVALRCKGEMAGAAYAIFFTRTVTRNGIDPNYWLVEDNLVLQINGGVVLAYVDNFPLNSAPGDTSAWAEAGVNGTRVDHIYDPRDTGHHHTRPTDATDTRFYLALRELLVRNAEWPPVAIGETAETFPW